MSEPFRNDLEAAQCRVDVLETENEELREQVSHLKKKSTPLPSLPSKGPQPADDPELASLAEHTLERLDELSEEIEAHEPKSPSPLVEKVVVGAPLRSHANDDHASIDYGLPLRDQDLLARLESAKEELRLARLERMPPRGFKQAAWTRMLAVLALGIVIGVVLATLAR